MKDKQKRFDELFEKQYEQGLRLTNQEYLEYWNLYLELNEEASKEVFYEAIEACDFRM